MCELLRFPIKHQNADGRQGLYQGWALHPSNTYISTAALREAWADWTIA
jgi:hypothetical protein